MHKLLTLLFYYNRQAYNTGKPILLTNGTRQEEKKVRSNEGCKVWGFPSYPSYHLPQPTNKHTYI